MYPGIDNRYRYPSARTYTIGMSFKILNIMKTINKIVGIVTSISLAGIMSCCSNDLTEKVYSSITQDSYEYTVKRF